MSKGSYFGGSTLVHLNPNAGRRAKANKASLVKAAERGLAEQDRLIATSVGKAAGYQRQLQRALVEERASMKRKQKRLAD